MFPTPVLPKTNRKRKFSEASDDREALCGTTSFTASIVHTDGDGVGIVNREGAAAASLSVASFDPGLAERLAELASPTLRHRA
jgi:hypothetical protein